MNAVEVLNELLANLIRRSKPGVNLLSLEITAETLLTLMGAESVNKGYQPSWAQTPFPSVLCLSVNDQIGHAPVRDYTLKDGDLLTIDCGVKVNNECADAGCTIGIGKITARDERLLRYTRHALLEGIQAIRVGEPITEVGKALEKYARRNGFVVLKRMSGHGIGSEMHMKPFIPMFDLGKFAKEPIPVFNEGQVVCIEPHLTYKDEFGIIDKDGWTVKARDGRKSAMAEHQVKVTSLGAEILTKHI